MPAGALRGHGPAGTALAQQNDRDNNCSARLHETACLVVAANEKGHRIEVAFPAQETADSEV
jgi:hypothetical protein